MAPRCGRSTWSLDLARSAVSRLRTLCLLVFGVVGVVLAGIVAHGLVRNNRLERGFTAVSVGASISTVRGAMEDDLELAPPPYDWLHSGREYHYQAWGGPTIYAVSFDEKGLLVAKYRYVSP